jgi:DNA-directed RNA polymerase subunit RPC12/RpoP
VTLYVCPKCATPFKLRRRGRCPSCDTILLLGDKDLVDVHRSPAGGYYWTGEAWVAIHSMVGPAVRA